MRDNPERVEFVGYDPQRVRYLVFIAAGGFAGLAGGMAAVNYEIFTPESLSLAPSGFVLLMAYIGGIRYFWGPALGALVLTWMQSNLSDYTEAWLLYLGLLFILIVMFAPAGLAGLVVALWHGVRRPGAGRRLARWAVGGLAGAVLFAGVVVLVEIAVRWSNGFGDVFEPVGRRAAARPADELAGGAGADRAGRGVPAGLPEERRMTGPALSIRDLRKSFGPAEIIRGVTLDIAPGERHAIIGPNGAGKSTLFNLISGLHRPTSGEVRLHGKRISGMKPHAINRHGPVAGRSRCRTSSPT